MSDKRINDGGPVTVRLERVRGRRGHECLVLNERRVWGPKPWGGGDVVEAWDIPLEELEDAMLATGENRDEQ